MHKLCATSRPRGRAKKIAVKTGEGMEEGEYGFWRLTLSEGGRFPFSLFLYLPCGDRDREALFAMNSGSQKARMGSKVMMIGFSTVQL